MDINKDLIAASSTPIVLAILAEGDSYGYAILQRVRELSGGDMEWTDGMLYPVLHRLERLGHVAARWKVADSGRRRKYYRITSAGRAQLVEERRQWQAVDATLRGIWSLRFRRRVGRGTGHEGLKRWPRPAPADRSRSRSTSGGAISAAGRPSTPSTPPSSRTTCASRWAS
jgi:DNA-binding PadR family transcriptional regulator